MRTFFSGAIPLPGQLIMTLACPPNQIRLSICLMTLLLFLQAQQAFGGGILYAVPPEIRGEVYPVARFAVQSSENLAMVSENDLEYTFRQTFLNDNEFPLESVYMLPVPEGLNESDIEVRVDDNPHAFKVISSPLVKETLRRIVQKHQESELLELWGKRVLMMPSLHLDSRKSLRIMISYKVKNRLHDGLLDLSLTLVGERYSRGVVNDFSVLVKFRTGRTVRSNLSHTHIISINSESPDRQMVSVRDRNTKIIQDFELLTTFGGTDFDLRIFNFDGTDSKSYFLMMLQPPADTQPVTAKKTDRDIIFLVDCSGSVGSRQLSVAKSVVVAGMNRLNNSDRFNLMYFDSSVKKFSDKPVTFSHENRVQAEALLGKLEPSGGSDLFNSIVASLELFNTRKKAGTIILFSDGRPTVGVTNFDSILDGIRRLNRYRSRIYVISVGDRPNALMMDQLASQNGGKLISASENVSSQDVVDRVFSLMRSPVINEISIDYEDIYPEDVFPESTSGISGNGTLFFLGSYDKNYPSNAKIRARAKIRGKVRSSSMAMKTAKTLEKGKWIETVWAMRKFARLLEREMMKNDPGTSERLSVLCNNYGFTDPFKKVYPGILSNDRLWDFSTSFIPSRIMSPSYRAVRDRLFRFSGGSWIDTTVKARIPIKVVAPFSDEFFALLDEDPDLAVYFSLGPQVTVLGNTGAISTRVSSLKISQ